MNEVYTDLEPTPRNPIKKYYKGEVKRLNGASRVNDLFAQFERLSRVEKDNFINKLTNYLNK